MRVLMFLPEPMQSRCFSQADLARLHKNHDVILTACHDGPELRRKWSEWAEQCDAIVTGWGSPVITDEMLDESPGVRLIVHAAGSVKHLLPTSVWDRGIRVASCNEALAIGVAETTLGMIIAGLKGFFPCNDLTHSGGWKISELACPGFEVREVYEVTIGLIGASQAGRHVIRLLRAFETTVLVADPHLSDEEAARLDVERVSLDQLMRRSDVVSLHAPALPDTRHLLGRDQFRAMKDGAIFINTARGAIVDEAALVAELETGRIRAFIDVTDPEPPVVNHPFRKLANVVLTPHIAGALSNGCLRVGRSAVDQLIRFGLGQKMPGEVTADRLTILA